MRIFFTLSSFHRFLGTNPSFCTRHLLHFHTPNPSSTTNKPSLPFSHLKPKKPKKPKPKYHFPAKNPNHHRTPPPPPPAAAVEIDAVTREEIPLSEKQSEVLNAVAQGRSVFITGSAGTGKSFLLKHAIRLLHCLHSPNRVFVTASTGVAACALSGMTLHSFSGVGVDAAMDADALLQKVFKNRPASQRWRRAKALVIDEISMIDGHLFDRLDLIARRLRRRPGNAWGGIQLVVSGDFFQLPPIDSPDPDKEFAFEADCWHDSFDLQVELTHVFRQSDARMVELLQAIRKERPDFDYFQFLSRCFVEPESGDFDSSVTRLFPRNEDVRRVNEKRLRSLDGEIVTYRALDKGKEPWLLRQGIAPEKLELCVGARVMLLKNVDPVDGLVNGTTGTVIGFDKSRRRVVSEICCRPVLPRVLFDSGVEMVVEPDLWDVMEGEMLLARRWQVPLKLAWALSIHKCQGMTLDRLHTDLRRAFGCGMVYVALSRVRSLDGLLLSGFSPRRIKAHPKVLQYSQQIFVE